jgi:ATP-dependent RNA helicase SUPV3L1/SUV3
VYYVFTWAPRRSGAAPRRGRGAEGRGKRPAKGGKPGKPKGDKGARGDKGKAAGKPQGARSYEARPPRREKPIDPDNPFAAALMGLKDKS